MIDHCYHPLPNLPKISQHYIDEAINADYSFPFDQAPDATVNRVPEVFRSPSSFINTDFCQMLQQQFGTVTPYYFLVYPEESIDWHVDFTRSCTINFVLNQVDDSVTLFREKLAKYRQRVYRCHYDLYCPVLFNTKVDHTIINYSTTQSRYLLTVGFSPEVTYLQVKDFLLNYTCDSY